MSRAYVCIISLSPGPLVNDIHSEISQITEDQLDLLPLNVFGFDIRRKVFINQMIIQSSPHAHHHHIRLGRYLMFVALRRSISIKMLGTILSLIKQQRLEHLPPGSEFLTNM
jgi:hypothetical protein